MEVAEALDGTGVRVVAVSFDTPARVGRYAAAFGRGVLFLCDPERLTYRRLGLGQASRARVWLHPAVWRAYWRLLRAGVRPAAPAGDTQQLGGDVVLSAELHVVWVYRSHGPEDRPALAEIRRQLQTVAASPDA